MMSLTHHSSSNELLGMSSLTQTCMAPFIFALGLHFVMPKGCFYLNQCLILQKKEKIHPVLLYMAYNFLNP